MSKRLCRGGAPAAAPAAKQSLPIGIAAQRFQVTKKLSCLCKGVYAGINGHDLVTNAALMHSVTCEYQGGLQNARRLARAEGLNDHLMQSLGELRGLFRAAGVLLPLFDYGNDVDTGRSQTNVIANRALPFDEHGVVHDVIANKDLLRAHELVERTIADAEHHHSIDEFCRRFCP